MKDVLAFGGEASQAALQAGLPNPLRGLNLDKVYRRYGNVSGLPEDDWFTLDEVAQHDKAREQAKQAASIPLDATSAVAGAKALSETQLGTGSALDAMLGVNARSPVAPPGPGLNG